MLQDAICPSCSHSFPVTEARNAFTVLCPRCEIELTAEFKKPAAPPEAGQPPFDLVVNKGGLPTPVAPGPKKKERRDDDEDDEPKRKGGSATVAFVTGGLGLFFVFVSLAVTGWFLFFYVDTETTWDKTFTSTTNNPGGNNSSSNNGGNNNNSGNNQPPKPKDTFELRPVSGTLPLIAQPTDIDPSSPKTVLLPGRANVTAVGGGGRYIVFHFPDQGRLAVFDSNIADLLPAGATMENGAAHMSAGANKMVVSVPGTKRLRVHSLPDLNKVTEFEVPTFFGPHGIAMGSRANGPVLVMDPFGRAILMDHCRGQGDRRVRGGNQVSGQPDPRHTR